MSAEEAKFSVDARDRMLRGIDTLAHAVRVTIPRPLADRSWIRMLASLSLGLLVGVWLGASFMHGDTRGDRAAMKGQAYAAKGDFDRAFADVAAASVGNTALRERLLLAGSRRLVPAPAAAKIAIVRTRIVTSDATPVLFSVDNRLRTTRLAEGSSFSDVFGPATATRSG